MPHLLPSHCLPLVGTHVSITDGLSQALAIGQDLGCTAVQFFTHSNRQWSFKLPTASTIDHFLKTKSDSGICSIVVHGSYLMNPASQDSDIHHKTLQTLVKEIQTCDLLDIPTLIIHPGSRLQTPLDDALNQCANTINQAITHTPDSKVRVLIETMAGQGSTIGTTFQELGTIIGKVEHKQRIGVCIDTCHIAAAGYQFYTADEYKALWREFEAIIGRQYLHAIHLNDSAKPRGSRVDRHTHIGEGSIGLETFRHIMHDKELELIPKILETPKDQELKDDKKNLALLHSL